MWIRRLSHPVVAGGVFNFVVILTHLTPVVNYSVENGPFHYLVHTVVFFIFIFIVVAFCASSSTLAVCWSI